MTSIIFFTQLLSCHVQYWEFLTYSKNRDEFLHYFFIPPLPEEGGGILFYLCPSVRLAVLPSVQDIFRRIFLSNC